MQLEAWVEAGLVCAGGLGGGERNAAAVRLCEDLAQNLIEPLDQRRRAAEVSLQRNEVEEQRLVVRRLKSCGFHAWE